MEVMHHIMIDKVMSVFSEYTTAYTLMKQTIQAIKGLGQIVSNRMAELMDKLQIAVL